MKVPFQNIINKRESYLAQQEKMRWQKDWENTQFINPDFIFEEIYADLIIGSDFNYHFNMGLY